MASLPSPPFEGKTIVVTGGTGSFGRAFITHLLTMGVRQVRCLSRDEAKQEDLRHLIRDKRLRTLLGDVRDADRLNLAFQDADVVVHAAALKRVPAGEYDPEEFVKTNVLGAMNVVKAARYAGVARVVGLSSDKATSPLNTYGATKLCMERLFVASNAYTGPHAIPKYSVTRYGNVAGSRGSVIPLFRQRLAHGEALPITDDRCTRFWMTMPEAVALVTKTITRMKGGEVFIPKLPSFRITDLVDAMGNGTTTTLGLRPGEKLHELLISGDEAGNVYDLDDCYAITNWPSGRRVQDGFIYGSDHNTQWLDVHALRRALADV